jgi:hypothetical protein
MFVGHSTAEFVFNPGGLSWRSLGRIENLGSGSSVYDPARRTVWSIRGDSLFATGEAAPTKKVSVLGPGLDSSSGMALAADGSLVFWNGGAQVMRYDPVTRDWLLFDGGAVSPPYYGVPVYSKWIAVPQLGVFVGDPPPLNWSTVYFSERRIKDGNETPQTRRDSLQVTAG